MSNDAPSRSFGKIVEVNPSLLFIVSVVVVNRSQVKQGKEVISYYFLEMLAAFIGGERRSKYPSSSGSDKSYTVLLSHSTR